MAKLSQDQIAKVVETITREAAGRGCVIAAGWAAYATQVLPADAGPVQRRETMFAFYAGAQHLWASVMTILEEGSEATDMDMQHMEKISAELERFRSLIMESGQ